MECPKYSSPCLWRLSHGHFLTPYPTLVSLPIYNWPLILPLMLPAITTSCWCFSRTPGTGLGGGATLRWASSYCRFTGTRCCWSQTICLCGRGLAEVVALPPPGLHTRHAVSALSFASVSVATHPVCVERWYFAPDLVTNTLLSDCAEAETEAKRRTEIRRNRNAGIIGWIKGLQSGGSEVGIPRKQKTRTKKIPSTGYFLF